MVFRMLSYFYGTNYTDGRLLSPHQDQNFVSKLDTNARIYAMGDKYDAQGLKDTAAKKFGEALANRAFMGAIPLNSPIAAFHVIYSTTPDNDRGLRDQVIHFSSKNWKDLVTYDQFKILMSENIDLAIDIVGKKEAVIETMQKDIPYNKACTRCKSTDQWEMAVAICGCGSNQRWN